MQRHRSRLTRRLPLLTVITAFGLGTMGAALTLAASGCGGEAAAESDVEAAAEASTPMAPEHYDPRQSLAPMVETVSPAVVAVDARGRRPTRAWRTDEDAAPRGMGSGFVIDAEGLVVTNHHVVDGAQTVQVRLSDGRRFDAQVVGSDPDTDLALLRLSGAEDLPVVTLGSSKELAVGDWVVAMGNPMGLDHSATVGIISGKGRGSLGLYRNSYIDFLQTDADIAPGSSGGPLFNLRGEVVGINTAVGSGLRPGFAIPVDQAKRVVEQLRDHGTVTRGWLGAGNVAEDGEVGATLGNIYEGTPAERAGLRSGDVVEALDGEPIESFEALRAWVGTKQPGDEVELRVRRDGALLELRATLEARPDSSSLDALRPSRSAAKGSADAGHGSSARPPGWLPFGLSVPSEGERSYGGEAPKEVRLGISARQTPRGLEVVEVREGSLAQTLGLQSGDLLRELGGREVQRPADVATALLGAGSSLEVRFERDGATHVVTLER